MTVREKYKKQREENKDKKLLFLGTAISCFDVDYDEFDEIWAMSGAFGECYTDIPRIDLGFEIHPMDQMIIIAEERKVNYNKFNCPIFVQDENNGIAKSIIDKPVTFPLDDVVAYAKEIGASVNFSDTYCYMLVYAAMMGYKDVLLYKILLTSDLEYYLERPAIEYWIDWLGHAEHIKFSFPEDAEMWTEDILYGYEQRPNLWKISSRKKYMWDVFTKHFLDVESLTGMLNRCGGMLELFAAITRGTPEEKIKQLIKECQDNINNYSPKLKKSRDMYMQFQGALQTITFDEERGY